MVFFKKKQYEILFESKKDKQSDIKLQVSEITWYRANIGDCVSSLTFEIKTKELQSALDSINSIVGGNYLYSIGGKKYSISLTGLKAYAEHSMIMVEIVLQEFKAEPEVEPAVETPVETPVVETKVEPVVEEIAEPVVESKVEPVVETSVETPVVETKVEPIAEVSSEPVKEKKKANRKKGSKKIELDKE
jgi:hypothetical protein